MTPADPQLLDKYAELAIKVGVNLQPGQRLLIATVPVELAPLVRVLSKKAYLAGARYVEVEWEDRKLDRIRLEYGVPESLDEFSEWRPRLQLEYLESGDALLAISAVNPDLMTGQDPQALDKMYKLRAEKLAPVLAHISVTSSNWSLIGGSTVEWARKVFPELSDDVAERRLWEAIFEICHVNSGDPVATWHKHLADLNARECYLNARSYDRLHYRAQGTDLTIGLPAGHLWRSGSLEARNGIRAVINIPTEEVFTLPHRERVNGTVRATKPLSYAGNIIDNFSLTFENGRVTQATAGSGQTTLHSLLGSDEGARFLGEVALVPHSSPISQSGLLFYNILYDENAACHLALGNAYRTSLEGGTSMSREEFAGLGGNNSLVHVDFMVGSGDLDVDGYREDGSVEPVLRNGEWAFEV